MQHIKNIIISLFITLPLIISGGDIEGNQADKPPIPLLDEEIIEVEKEPNIGGVIEICPIQKEIIVPEWKIKYPVICPQYTQYFKNGHRGIDLISCEYLQIFSAESGIVTYAGWMTGYGNVIIIDHQNGFVTLYAHLSSIIVIKDQEVLLGQTIGIMGTTGNSTGIHLHFELQYNGVKLNPDNYLIKI